MIYMICKECGFKNKKGAKFCAQCGQLLQQKSQYGSDNYKMVIVALVIVIIILVGALGFFVLSANSSHDPVFTQGITPATTVSSGEVSYESGSGSNNSDNAKTQNESSTTNQSKSWELIGSYSGSGSGSKTITVPEGKIMVELSAYPIKNYATNHLTVSGSNGESGGVEWGSKSAVKTRSDSFTYESSASETFTIDYYETVSWEVYFYKYQ